MDFHARRRRGSGGSQHPAMAEPDPALPTGGRHLHRAPRTHRQLEHVAPGAHRPDVRLPDREHGRSAQRESRQGLSDGLLGGRRRRVAGRAAHGGSLRRRRDDGGPSQRSSAIRTPEPALRDFHGGKGQRTQLLSPL